MAARHTQDVACKESIAAVLSQATQPGTKAAMLAANDDVCKECKHFDRFACTYCDWLTCEAVHAHKPSATCSLHL